MKIPTSLLKVFLTLQNCKVYGHLTTPEVGATSTLTPFQLFHVPQPCRIIRVGDLIKGNGGDHLLLMDAPQTSLAAKTFRAYTINAKHEWRRNVKTLDPVSKLERDQGLQSMGELYCYFEKPEESMMHNMSSTRYQFYTGQDVKEGDLVGKKMVKKVMKVLGVNLVIAE